MESKVYDYIVKFITENGYSPSIREICAGVGVKSTSSVHDYVKMLEEYGKIKTKDMKSRTITLVGYEYRKAAM